MPNEIQKKIELFARLSVEVAEAMDVRDHQQKAVRQAEINLDLAEQILHGKREAGMKIYAEIGEYLKKSN